MKLDKIFVWREWLNPRNKRCWLLGSVAIYTLLSFLLVPWLIRDQLKVSDSGGKTKAADRQVTIELGLEAG